MSAAHAALQPPEPSDELVEAVEPEPSSSRAGKRLRSVAKAAAAKEQAAASQGSSGRNDRGAADLRRAQRAVELLRRQLDGLEQATARRDFTSARALASSLRATAPGLAASIERARRAGADAAALAAVERRAAELTPRLKDAMARAPQDARGLGFDLLDPSAEERLEAQWLAKLDGAAADPAAPRAAPSFAGGKASSESAALSTAQGRTVAPSHEAFEAAADYRIHSLVKAGKHLAAPAYLHHNMRELRLELGSFLAAHLTSTGHAQVDFTESPGAFVTQLLAELRPADASACVTLLGQWLTPAELYAIVDRNRAIFERPEKPLEINYERGPKGPATWSPAVSAALGAALLDKLIATLPKMSQRLVAISTVRAASAAEGAGGEEASAIEGESQLTVRDFGPLSPLELQIARAFLGRRGDPAVSVLAKPAMPAPAPAKEGNTTSRRDAKRGKNIPPRERSQKRSARVDSAAEAPTVAKVISQWRQIDEYLQVFSARLGFAGELIPAVLAHVSKRLDLESLTGRDLQMRATAFTQQHEILDTIRVAADPLIAKVELPDAQGPTPVRDSLRMFAKAAGHSHLPETARRYLSKATHTQRDQVFASLEAMCGQIASRLELAHQLAETTRGRTRYSAHILGKTIQVRHEEAVTELAAIRGAVVGGGALDAQRLEALTSRLDKLHFEATLISNAGAVGQIFQIFDELENERWVMFSEGLWVTDEDKTYFGQNGRNDNDEAQQERADAGEDPRAQLTQQLGWQKTSRANIGRLEAIRRGASTLRAAITTAHSRWLRIERIAQMLENGRGGDQAQRPATGLVAKAASAAIEKEFAYVRRLLEDTGNDQQVALFLQEGVNTAKSAQRRALYVQIAVMLGVAIASSGAAAAATGVAAGLGAGAMTAQLAGVAAESLAFSALTARLNGDGFSSELLANFAGNLVTFGAMSGAKALVQGSKVGKVLAAGKAAGRGRLAMAKTIEFTSSAITAAAVQYAQAQATSLAQRGRVLGEQELQQTLVQGLAMAIGSSVLGMTRSLERAKANLARTVAAHRQLKTLARQVAHTGDPAQAMQLLHELRIQLEIEHAHWKEMQALSPKELQERDLSPEHVGDMAAHSGRQLTKLDRLETSALPAQLSLDAVVPGHVYAGEPAAVARVRDSYQAKGYTVEKLGDDGEYSVSKLGETPLKLIERAAPASGGKKSGQRGKANAASASARGNSSTKKTKAIKQREVSVKELNELRYKEGLTFSDFTYDAKTRTVSFERDIDGVHTRYTAKHPPPTLTLADWEVPNRVVGTRTFKDLAGAEGIVRQISGGNLDVIKQLGAEVPADLKNQISAGLEFGVGRRPDGEFVVVRGDLGEVDWDQLPGVKMEAHSHASIKGNDLPQDVDGNQRISIADVLKSTMAPLIAREMIMPSTVDVRTLANNGVGAHRVFTPYIVKGEFIMKPPADWQDANRLEFVVERSVLTVYVTKSGLPIYKADFSGQFGGRQVMKSEVYVAAPDSGPHPDEGIFMELPEGAKKAANHAGK